MMPETPMPDIPSELFRLARRNPSVATGLARYSEGKCSKDEMYVLIIRWLHNDAAYTDRQLETLRGYVENADLKKATEWLHASGHSHSTDEDGFM